MKKTLQIVGALYALGFIIAWNKTRKLDRATLLWFLPAPATVTPLVPGVSPPAIGVIAPIVRDTLLAL